MFLQGSMKMTITAPKIIKPASKETTTPSCSPWSPLKVKVFRAIWIASLVSTMGIWMHSVAAAWFMTSLTSSPLLIALLQTATSLPVFILGLPAGAIADLVDRRLIILLSQGWMLL